jgi:hypothetical protein
MLASIVNIPWEVVLFLSLPAWALGWVQVLRAWDERQYRKRKRERRGV